MSQVDFFPRSPETRVNQIKVNDKLELGEIHLKRLLLILVICFI